MYQKASSKAIQDRRATTLERRKTESQQLRQRLSDAVTLSEALSRQLEKSVASSATFEERQGAMTEQMDAVATHYKQTFEEMRRNMEHMVKHAKSIEGALEGATSRIKDAEVAASRQAIANWIFYVTALTIIFAASWILTLIKIEPIANEIRTVRETVQSMNEPSKRSPMRQIQAQRRGETTK